MNVRDTHLSTIIIVFFNVRYPSSAFRFTTGESERDIPIVPDTSGQLASVRVEKFPLVYLCIRAHLLLLK